MIGVKGYAIKLIAISIFFVLIECVEPGGRMKGILKTVVSIIFTIILISPIISAFKNFSFDQAVSFEEYTLDFEILEKVKNYQKTYLKNQVEAYLQNEGITDSVIDIEYTDTQEDVSTNTIKKITIILPFEVIKDKDENILITKIKDDLSNGLKIDREMIDVIVK